MLYLSMIKDLHDNFIVAYDMRTIQDNACAESFFSTLKAEFIYRNKIKTFDEAKKLIDEYIYFYNYQRFQLKTKLTPFEKRCQSLAN